MFHSSPFLSLKVIYKNNDVRLELSRLAKQGDPKMKVCNRLIHSSLSQQHFIFSLLFSEKYTLERLMKLD